VRDTIEEAVLADAVGIDSFNVGEHYRPDFMDSAGHVMLVRSRAGPNASGSARGDGAEHAGPGARVHRVRDSRRGVERAGHNSIVGRGSLTDSFPLFGFDLADYETLVRGEARPAYALAPQPTGDVVRQLSVAAQPTSNVSPPLPEGHLPTWVGVGGSPQSVLRAARYGLH